MRKSRAIRRGAIWEMRGYPIIIATFGFVFVQAGRGRLPLLVALPFAINLVASLIFTPIQWRRPRGSRRVPEQGLAFWRRPKRR